MKHPPASVIIGKAKALAITIDTREQDPYAYPPEYATVTSQCLKTGDYALTGDHWPIERKSVSDLIGTIISSRLEGQMQRMRAQVGPDRIMVICVDGDKQAFATWKHWPRCGRASCAWAFSELYRIAYEYKVCVDWNPSRRWAAMSCWRWLRTRQKASVK